ERCEDSLLPKRGLFDTRDKRIARHCPLNDSRGSLRIHTVDLQVHGDASPISHVHGEVGIVADIGAEVQFLPTARNITIRNDPAAVLDFLTIGVAAVKNEVVQERLGVRDGVATAEVNRARYEPRWIRGEPPHTAKLPVGYEPTYDRLTRNVC